MRILIALGGNALIRAGERGTWAEQQRNALLAARAVCELHRAGHEIVLAHGNGPQVGLLALQQAARRARCPRAAASTRSVAMTQGQIGYLLQDALARVDPDLPTATVLTRARVDADDPAFASAPTKPIGPFYDEDEARRSGRGARLGRRPRRRPRLAAAWS